MTGRPESLVEPLSRFVLEVFALGAVGTHRALSGLGLLVRTGGGRTRAQAGGRLECVRWPDGASHNPTNVTSHGAGTGHRHRPSARRAASRGAVARRARSAAMVARAREPPARPLSAGAPLHARPRSEMAGKTPALMRGASSILFRARIDDLPQLGTVLEVLHLRGEAAVPGDPVLDRFGIDRHQFGRAGDAGHPDAGRPALVIMGLMEPEACPRRDADLAQRNHAEEEGAGGIAGAVDDDALALVADARIFGLVLVDITTVILRDPQIRGCRHRQGEEDSEACNPHHTLKLDPTISTCRARGKT